MSAQRCGTEGGVSTLDTDASIRRLMQYLFQREPMPRELAAARGLVEEHGLMWLARVLLNSNEFVIIE
jgi:hypothetical protein